jgi:hypothetical protein
MRYKNEGNNEPLFVNTKCIYIYIYIYIYNLVSLHVIFDDEYITGRPKCLKFDELEGKLVR